MNKKGQGYHLWLQEQRSLERQERIRHTRNLFKKGLNLEKIAVRLGVSVNTIKSYLKEAKELHKQDKERERLEKEEKRQEKIKKALLNKEILSLKKKKIYLYYSIKLRWWVFLMPIFFVSINQLIFWISFILSLIIWFNGFGELLLIKKKLKMW